MLKKTIAVTVAAMMLGACADKGGDAETAAQSGATSANATAADIAMPADATKTESGLRYAELTPGTGATPAAGQTAVVHYTGWLTDGTKFDSSVDRGEPFEFPLGQGMVIKGWDEGVSTMKVGGKRRLEIPADLGYGANGAGGVIPPDATLIFDVELLDTK